jgi:large subunit ribosomal protein L6
LSRVGRLPLPLPSGVQVKVSGSHVAVSGPKGQLERDFDSRVSIKVDDQTLVVSRSSEQRDVRALHGLTRALVANMVHGVHSGFRKSLDVQGVGYRAEVQGKELILLVGFSHPVKFAPPTGIALSVEQGNRTIHVDGVDKELVGEVAAKIRAIRPPEPYKGKGIRYLGETVRRKAGKAGKVAAAAAA